PHPANMARTVVASRDMRFVIGGLPSSSSAGDGVGPKTGPGRGRGVTLEATAALLPGRQARTPRSHRFLGPGQAAPAVPDREPTASPHDIQGVVASVDGRAMKLV